MRVPASSLWNSSLDLRAVGAKKRSGMSPHSLSARRITSSQLLLKVVEPGGESTAPKPALGVWTSGTAAVVDRGFAERVNNSLRSAQVAEPSYRLRTVNSLVISGW